MEKSKISTRTTEEQNSFLPADLDRVDYQRPHDS